MTVKPSLSVTNSQAEVVVQIVRDLIPDVVPVRRPHQELPPGGRWFNGVTGWAPLEPMADWTSEEIIGYVLDALEDGRSTNLNKGAVFRLLRFLEGRTGWPFFFQDRYLEPADRYCLVHISSRDLARFHDDRPPLDRISTAGGSPKAGPHRSSAGDGDGHDVVVDDCRPGDPVGERDGPPEGRGSSQEG